MFDLQSNRQQQLHETDLYKQFRVPISIRFTKTLERCFILVMKLYLQFLGYEIRNPD